MMYQSKLAFVGFVVVVVILGVTGCRQKGPKVYFVQGKVTLNDEPVVDADIGFTPKSGEAGIPATGKTDEQGIFRLTSAQGGVFGKGAVAGEYDVRIIKFTDPDYVEPENVQLGQALPMAKPRHLLPERYANVKTSGLSATVEAKKNIFNFELKK